MSQDRLLMVVGVHLILRRGNDVFLARRFKTGYADGCYNFPCGHLDPGESLTTGMAREAREEIGISISESDLKFLGCTHWQSNKQSVNFFFECRNWTGEFVNGEPDKCDHMDWFSFDALPVKLVSQTEMVIDAIGRGEVPFLIEMKD